jgi:hypothetical protein
MHRLFDLFIDAIQLIIPWGSHHDDQSVVGKSPMDLQAVWIARGLLVLLIIAGVAYAIWKK